MRLNLLCWLGLTSGTLIFGAEEASRPIRAIDPLRLNNRTMRMLEQNREAQIKAIQGSKVFHQFSLRDHAVENGLGGFEHRAVDDASKNWKPAHYDHGCGVAVADVDGDGLSDLYFANQIGGNALFRNAGNGKFEDVTESAGVGLPERISVAAAFADVDNDGLPDLFVTTVRMGNVLFKNLGKGKFKDVTSESGLEYKGHSSGAVFLDFNRDGWLDLFIANVGDYTLEEQGVGGFYLGREDAFTSHTYPERSERSLLYQNMGGGKFKEVSREMGLVDEGWSGDATFSDLNLDGYPEIYVLNMQGDDHFYQNAEGKRLVESTAEFFPKTPWGAMGIKFFDFNLDGALDLFITDMHSDMTDSQTAAGKRDYSQEFDELKSDRWCMPEWGEKVLQGSSNNILGNAFYLNQGNGKFAEVSGKIGAETYWPWGMSVGDLNADGYEDVFVTGGMGYPFRYAPNNILLNERGEKFHRSEFVLGAEPPMDDRIQKPYFILDCSGADKDNNLCYGRRGQVAIIGSISSRSSVVMDMDEDGDLDVIVNQMHDRPLALRSDLSDQQKIAFLKVKLVGTKSNRDGFGATVRLTAGGKTQTRFHDGKSGYLAQSTMPLYFGLGDAKSVEKIEVLWPSGIKQAVSRGVALNKSLTITEPAN